MTDYLALFRALTANDSNWAASANSANSLSSGPNGTIGTIGAGKKTPLPSDMADHDGYEERAALVTWEAGVPIEWAEGFATLQTALLPRSMTESRWRQIIDDAGRFLDRWAANAAALGWTTLDVFGVHPGAPEARHDGKGLVPLIAGGEIIAITAETARLRSGPGEQTFRRMPTAHAVALWQLVEGTTQSTTAHPQNRNLAQG